MAFKDYVWNFKNFFQNSYQQLTPFFLLFWVFFFFFGFLFFFCFFLFSFIMTHYKYYFEILFYETFVFIKDKKILCKKKEIQRYLTKKHRNQQIELSFIDNYSWKKLLLNLTRKAAELQQGKRSTYVKILNKINIFW